MTSIARKTTNTPFKKKTSKPKKSLSRGKTLRTSSASIKKTSGSSFKKTASGPTFKKKVSGSKKGTIGSKTSGWKTSNIKVKDVMQKNVLSMNPDDTLQNAAKKMHDKDLGYIFVNKNQKVTGIVTARDIIIRAVSKGKKLESLKLKDIMSSKILYCSEQDSLEKATQNMAKNKIHRLPVLNKAKKLVGVISFGNIASHSTKKSGKSAKNSGKTVKKTGKKKIVQSKGR